MGLLKVGRPLTWEESLEHLQYVREHGVLQFLNTYDALKTLVKPELKWGEEMEFGIFKVDHAKRSVALSLRGDEIRGVLAARELEYEDRLEGCTWQPEFGAWMVESTPNRPYGAYAHDLLRVETNMRLRRARLLTVLGPDEICPSVTAFPLMGVGAFTDPPLPPGGPVSRSQTVPDGCINPHPRFAALVRNIRSRRGSTVQIRAPLFWDAKTPEFAGLPPPTPPLPLRSSSSKGGLGGGGHATPRIREEGGQGGQGGDGDDDDRTLPPSARGSKAHAEGYVWQLDGLGLEEVEGEAKPPQRQQQGAGAGAGAEAATASPVTASGKAAADAERKGPEVVMDAMAYGMGMCCLQVTFQARDVAESRYIFDQMAVLGPIMLALTAGTPILQGRLVDTDVRWNTIAGAVDDRTPAERGEVASEDARADPRMAGGGAQRLAKSRYDAISCYIYSCQSARSTSFSDLSQQSGVGPGAGSGSGLSPRATPRSASGGGGMWGGGDEVLNAYNDVPVEVDEGLEALMLERGLDPILARHVAHLFTRDPLVVFQGAVEEVDDATSTEHWENIQSTNWQSVRWKPPPPVQSPTDPRIGWRTEFRTMEIQLTDFENAAFTVFVVLLTRIILAFDLHLYIPISKLDENMRRAHARDAVHTQKFFFRKHMADLDGGGEGGHCRCTTVQEYEEMTVAEIMTGKGKYFPGLIPLCEAYLAFIQCDRETREKVGKYLELIRRRACGEVLTTAAWVREFVQRHPEYQHDSVVSPSIAYDLMMECKTIGEGLKRCPALLGEDVVIEPIESKEAYDARLTSNKLGSSERAQVLAAYLKRASFLKRHGSSSVDGSGSGAAGALGASVSDTGGSFVSPARGPTSPRKPLGSSSTLGL